MENERIVYKVYFTKKAEKELSKLASIDQTRLLKKFPLLSSPFSSSLDIKKLTNTPGFYRLRVGDVRVLFEIDDGKKEVWIRKIKYRGSVYEP